MTMLKERLAEIKGIYKSLKLSPIVAIQKLFQKQKGTAEVGRTMYIGNRSEKSQRDALVAIANTEGRKSGLPLAICIVFLPFWPILILAKTSWFSSSTNDPSPFCQGESGTYLQYLRRVLRSRCATIWPVIAWQFKTKILTIVLTSLKVLSLRL